MPSIKPLVLDVDGTFLKTDMLWETFWAGLGRSPFATLRAVMRYLGNRAALKAALAQIAPLRTDLLPVNGEVADLALQSRVGGREVVLASGSDESLVAPLAAHYGLSERVFASDGHTNLTGPRKAAELVRAFGEGARRAISARSTNKPRRGNEPRPRFSATERFSQKATS